MLAANVCAANFMHKHYKFGVYRVHEKPEELKLESLKSFFDPQKAVFSEKKSSKNTFTSLSIKIEMHSPEQVIEIYKKSSKLEGIIAL